MALYTRIKGPVGYTTIGSPTMTDGIATGFSSSNYYKLDTPFLPGNNAWQIVIRAKFNNLTSRHTLISHAASNTKSVQLTTTVNGTLVTYLSSNGTSTNLANAKTSTLTVQANTWYYFRIRFTKTSYEISVSEDREVWTTYITVNSSTPVWQGAYLSIGYNYRQYPEPMDGYIDFNNSYIQIEDTAFWGYSISRAKIRTNPFVKYEVVGSPTIVDGVVSGFSSSNYVKTEDNLPSNITFLQIHTEAIKANYPSSPYGIFMVNGYPSIEFQGRTFRMYVLNQDGTNTAYGYQGESVNANEKVLVDMYWENGTTRFVAVQNGVTVLDKSYQNTKISSGYVSFGWRWNPLNGSIDLNETYIKVNGQYWFNGAMQNVETWTPHIKDN